MGHMVLWLIMTTAILVKKLNKEVQSLRRDMRRIQSSLVKIKKVAIREESIRDYENASHIKRAYRRALKA